MSALLAARALKRLPASTTAAAGAAAVARRASSSRSPSASASASPSSMAPPPPPPPPRADALNVLGGPLECCCTAPMTGWHRDGFCRTGAGDVGVHTICARVDRAFLDYTRSRGNDLETPRPPHFAGLVPGSKWCLCASRWLEAAKAGAAPPVVLAACDAKALLTVDLALLEAHAWAPGE